MAIASHEFMLAIDDLYAGIHDPAKMTQFLSKAAAAAGCSGGELVGAIPGTPGARHHRFGMTDETYQQYLDYYIDHDPLLKALIVGHVPQPYMAMSSARDAVDLDWLKTTELCADWYSQIGSGVWDSCMATLSAPGTNMLGFGLYRDAAKGLIEVDELKALDRFLPHVQRALLLMESIDRAEDQLRTARVALDYLPVGVMSCSSDGRVDWSNRVGRAYIAQSGSVTLKSGRLTLTDPQLQKALVRCLMCAAHGTESKVAAFSVPQSRGPVIQMAICPASHSRGFVAERGRAIVFLSDARPDEFSLAVMSALFGFTPAEARVVVELVRGLTPAEISLKLLVSLETVRTQLKSAYVKTETGSQAKLVAHVLGGLGWIKEPVQ